jgi:hypothetical protein
LLSNNKVIVRFSIWFGLIECSTVSGVTRGVLRASCVANDCGSDGGTDAQETRSDAQRVAASLLAVVCRRFIIRFGSLVAKLLGRLDLPGFLTLIY